MKPIIGVIPLWDDEKESIWMLPDYMNVLEDNNAIPIMFPLSTDKTNLDRCYDMVDGILFTGGHDINPKLYNQEKKEVCGVQCDKRDEMESYLFKKAIKDDKPILGICRGIQLFNALLGGTLYQDLPTEHSSEIKHTMIKPYNRGIHSVDILKSTPLYKIIEVDKLSVNSYHHQAIKDLAPSLVANAISEDGLIEAISMTNKKFVMAVQWHPEFLWKNSKENNLIIAEFIKYATK